MDEGGGIVAYVICLLCGKHFAQNGSTSIVCPNHTRLSVEDTREALSVIELAEKAVQQIAVESEA